MRIILALMVFSSSWAFSQSKVYKQPTPTWVETVGYADASADTVDTGGYHYLLIDRQFNVITKENYRRTVTKVITESGLETVAAINVNFDPAFQSICFHTLVVKRGDRIIDKLPKARFETLRREQNLDRLIYDKSLDAILNLDDIQVGDIVEYSYSLRGYNPVFNNKFSKTVYFNYSDPTARLFTRIVTSTSRPLWIKVYNDATKPDEKITGNKIIYTWSLENIPALASDDKTPSWYDPYNYAEISEFDSWHDVSAWALPLYVTPRGPIPEVEKKLNEIKQRHPKLEDQVNACIRFVQDEIRYLSFSDGIQGYKPHSPAQVIRQRFGDCKDKSLLLTYMLKKLGVAAHPALVNTSTGKALHEELPSPLMFDHCIAEFRLNDSTYWVDPTITLQRGQLNLRTTSNYQQALVIAAETQGLTPMTNAGAWHSRIRVKEDYTLEYVGGPARLVVQTTYSGAEADDIRNYWKSHSAAEIKKSYTNFYANEYPGIRADSNIVFADNEQTNTIVSHEYYSIKNMWHYDSAAQQYSAEFYARLIAGYLSTPSVKTRSMPLAVTYPAAMDQIITVHLPEPWNITESTKKITSPAFVYTSTRTYTNNSITLSYAYQALGESVDAGHAANHIEKVSEAANDLSYTITYTTATASNSAEMTSTVNFPYISIMIVLAGLLFLVFRKLYYYDPRSQNYNTAYDQIGGILILPLIGIVTYPFFSAYQLLNSNYFDIANWKILTDSTYTGYDPGRGLLILWEFVHDLCLVGFSILLIILLIRKRTSFPLLVCIFCGINVLGVLVDSCWLNLLGFPPALENNGLPAGLRTILSAIVWVPYFIKSNRVKGTFRQRLD